MTFGDLVVNLGVNSSKFTKGLAGARGSLGSFKNSLGSITSGLGRMATAVASFGGAIAGVAAGGAVTMAGLGLAVNSSMGRIDEMAKSADKLGIGTESFAGLAHAANLSGVEMVGLESSMLKLTKNVSAAAAGNQGLAAKFGAVGLNVQALLAMRPDQQFYAVADSISQLTNASDKVRVATELFGQSGADLLPMLKDGSKGLAAMQADAEHLGLTFSRLDASKVEEANDAISRMKSAFGSLSDTMAITFAPVLTEIAGALTEFVAASRKLADEFAAGWEAAFDRIKHFGVSSISSKTIKHLYPGPTPWRAPEVKLPDTGPLVNVPAPEFIAAAAAVVDLPAKRLAESGGGDPEGLLKGSRAAIDRMASFRNQHGGMDPQRQLVRHAQRTEAGIDRLVKAVADLTRNREPVLIGGFN